MFFTALLILVVGIPAFVIVGAIVARQRGLHRGFPPATDGGSPTVYRRRILHEREDKQAGVLE